MEKCLNLDSTINAILLNVAKQASKLAIKEVMDNLANNKEIDRLMTPEQVVERLQVSKPTLWRWSKRGYLVPVRVGGQTKYRQSDVERIMEGDEL